MQCYVLQQYICCCYCVYKNVSAAKRQLLAQKLNDMIRLTVILLAFSLNSDHI